ncbi:diguanylate cyclase domain-containing protein [Oceanospirillum sp.]|uniref:diguanylate cyclase domain-containing protein n=1 Tax=Oceanospirillum sp. TaxID=2021254 RepID=UPI003A8FEDDB
MTKDDVNVSQGIRRSLKISLITPFIVLMLLVTFVISTLSYLVGSNALASLSKQLLTEQTERISLVVDRHMYGSGAVLETAFPHELSASSDLKDDLPAMRERFWTATALYPESNNYVYYGNEAGQSFGLKRSREEPAEIRLCLDNDVTRNRYRLDSLGDNPEFLYRESKPFDPRERPWYRTVQHKTKHTWTAVYVDFSSEDLVVTRARQVLSAEGKTQGVVATDLPLSQLNRFVQQLRVSKDARTAIVEPNGMLIAASFSPNVERIGNEVKRVNGIKTQDPLFNSLLNKYLPQFSTIDPKAPAAVTLTNAPDGTQVLVAYKRITDDAGLDWVALIIEPYSDVIGSSIRLTVWLALASLLAIIIAITIGSRRLGHVANVIRSLATTVSQFGDGKRVSPITTKRDDEIGLLATSFKKMQQQLFTDQLTGTANRNALQPYLERQITIAAEKKQQVALLFIDLNKFKPLNDTWGHINGDLALREISLRLQQIIGEDDILARLGGDEFVIVLSAPADDAHIKTTTDAVYEQVSKPLQTLDGIPEGTEVSLGASIGVACYPEDGLDAQTLLDAADQKMYADKKKQRAGR